MIRPTNQMNIIGIDVELSLISLPHAIKYNDQLQKTDNYPTTRVNNTMMISINDFAYHNIQQYFYCNLIAFGVVVHMVLRMCTTVITSWLVMVKRP